MHRCVSAPSCCTFILKAAFQEVSEHRILIKSGPGNWSLSASGTTHKTTYRISPWDRPHPEFCREGRAPLQTKQGNRPTGHDQEGRVRNYTSVYSSLTGQGWNLIEQRTQRNLTRIESMRNVCAGRSLKTPCLKPLEWGINFSSSHNGEINGAKFSQGRWIVWSSRKLGWKVIRSETISRVRILSHS